MTVLLAVVLCGVVAALVVQRLRQKPRLTTQSGLLASSQPSVAELHRRGATVSQGRPLPAHLPLKTREWFFTRSESEFLELLESVLPSGYRVFPNVRLSDLFYVAGNEYPEKQGVQSRLQDKKVDFLIVSVPEHRPMLALDLGGKTQEAEREQGRDPLKETAFKSAQLPLLRLRAEETQQASILCRRLEQAGVHTRRAVA